MGLKGDIEALAGARRALKKQKFDHSNFKCFYRFEEECTEIEEENCQTVYDDAWENKCQSVNVTLPSSTCREVTRTVMELKCVRCFTKNCLVIDFITLELTIWFRFFKLKTRI